MKRKTKIIIYIALVLLITALSCILLACNPQEPENRPTYRIEYTYPKSGGYYLGEGSTTQYVKHGQNSISITAIPFEGFTFVKWSDGVTTPTRTELNVQKSIKVTARFQRINLKVTFNASEGGHLEGDADQSIDYGNDSCEVTAVANQGYLFAGWSDGVMRETRIEKEVKQNIEATALFVKDVKHLTYEFDIPSALKKEVSISHDNLSATKFYIPEKEGYLFDGWYLDKKFTKKVTDGNGYYFRGNTIFYDKSDTLYPKWITEINQTFKLLLAFIENVDAQLPTKENELIDIDYHMTREERVVCELIPGQISDKLNSWFDGSVVFEVDTFYITETVLTEFYNDLQPGWSLGQPTSNSHRIDAFSIPQTSSIVKDYRSVILTGSMNDFEGKLHNYSGSASDKYAYVVFEDLQQMLKTSSIQEFIEFNPLIWEVQIDTYLHEFTHTLESAIEAYDLHEVIKYYWLKIDNIEVIRLYLLNQAKIDSKIVGIPMSFWKGNTNVKVSYVPSYYGIGGYDNGKIRPKGFEYESEYDSFLYYIPFGSDITVEAIPFEGWRFVKWSDGITTAVRHDKNVISYLHIYAIFEKV